MTDLQVPTGWIVRGYFPPFDPQNATDDQRDLLTEDLLSISVPEGWITIDVGWYPEASPSGRFRCRLVLDDQWDDCFEEVDLRRRDDALDWIAKAIDWARRHRGQPGVLGALAPVVPHTVGYSFVGRDKSLATAMTTADSKVTVPPWMAHTYLREICGGAKA